MQEVVLQIDRQQRRARERDGAMAHAMRSTMTVAESVDAGAEAGIDHDRRVGLFEDRRPVDARADRQVEPGIDRRLAPAAVEPDRPRAAPCRVERRVLARARAPTGRKAAGGRSRPCAG